MTDPIVTIEPVVQTVTIQAVTPTITVASPGPQGIPGPKGDPGASGFFVYTQNTPSDTWTIPHNLNGHPTAVVLDSGGAQCEGNIAYTDANTMVITFTSAFSGTAYII